MLFSSKLVYCHIFCLSGQDKNLNIQIGDHSVKQGKDKVLSLVEYFKYLRVLFKNKGKIEREINWQTDVVSAMI